MAYEILNEIDALKDKILSMRPLTQGELERLRDSFVEEYTYNSTAIEGNTLTLYETRLVLEGLTVSGKPLRCHLEAFGHKEAFGFIEENINAEISGRLIRHIHSLVLADRPRDAGTFRRIPVRISGAENTPPDPVMIPELIERLIEDYRNNTSHAIIRAALFHLKFEGIHPFVDGNGRTGRLILNMSLMKEGYLPVDVKFSDRVKYYDAFSEYYSTGNPEGMINLVAEYELRSLKERVALLTPDS